MVLPERLGECSITLQFIRRRENTAFQLVRLEAAPGFQFLCEGDKLTDRPDLPFAIRGIWVAEEQVGGKRNSIPQPPAQNFRNARTPRPPEEVQADGFE